MSALHIPHDASNFLSFDPLNRVSLYFQFIFSLSILFVLVLILQLNVNSWGQLKVVSLFLIEKS